VSVDPITAGQPAFRRAQFDDNVSAVGETHADYEREMFLFEQPLA
jgi:hypothetical protein